jgi:hypothetical protein
MITPVLASAARIAWSSKRQSAFGSPLSEVEFDRFIRLKEPLIVDESAEHWNDRGSVGSGHDWTENRGVERQSVAFEIPFQPLPVDFIGYLLGLLFSSETAQATPSGANQHSCAFQSLKDRPSAWTTSIAVGEDDQNYVIQDAAVKDLALSGGDNGRLTASAGFVASRIGDGLSGNSWPDSVPLRYLYNYAGSFSLGGDSSRTSQLKSFSLRLNSGINTDQAWLKNASETERIFPSWWPYSPARSMALTISLLGSSGDLEIFRNAQQQTTPAEVVISCLGETINGTSPPETDLVELTIPQAVFTRMNYHYDGGMLVIDLTAEGNYHAATGGPVSVRTVEGSVAEYFT